MTNPKHYTVVSDEQRIAIAIKTLGFMLDEMNRMPAVPASKLEIDSPELIIR